VLFEALDSKFEMRFPLQPFHGTIGVAPAAFEARNVLVPDSFGGNMDSPEVRAGTTVYLGVNVPGALFSLGDGHYTMGEGEACGAGGEGAMNTVLVVDVVKETYCEWPRLESDEAIMVAGSCRPLEDAFRVAHAQVVRWVAGDSASRSWTPINSCRRQPGPASPTSSTPTTRSWPRSRSASFLATSAGCQVSTAGSVGSQSST